jgi:hypothetical protein
LLGDKRRRKQELKDLGIIDTSLIVKWFTYWVFSEKLLA